MRGQAALLALTLLPLGSCKKGLCATGLLSAELGCKLDLPAPCEEGTVRHSDGSCKAPYGYEVRDGERLDAPEGGLPGVDTLPGGDDSDVPSETGIGDTWEIDLDTDVPFETDVPRDSAEPGPSAGPCDYELRIHTVSFAFEIGFELRFDGETVFSILPGELSANDFTYTFPLLEMTPGSYTAVLFDSDSDGWHGGFFEVVRLASNLTVATGALNSGRVAEYDVFLSCSDPF